MNKNNDSFRNSFLDRTKTAKSRTSDKSKLHRSDTGLVEDSVKNTTVVRIIVALLLVHILIIGGVLVRDDLVRSVKADGVSPTLTQPPAPMAVIPQPAQPTVQQETPAATADAPHAAANTPIRPVVVTPATPVPPAAPTAPETNHITTPATQPAATQPKEAIAVDPEPVVENDRPNQKRPVKHYVQSGDTWTRIVSMYGITSELLQKANPKVKPDMLIAGTYLAIPDKNGRLPEEMIEAAGKPTAAQGTVYAVKRGDTLSAIARKHGISLKKLMELNSLTEKDARRIQVGQKLRVSE